MYWEKKKEKICIECYEKEYGERDLNKTLEITRKKERCDYCGKEKNLVVEKINGYFIFN